jgi:hypothetical protein
MPISNQNLDGGGVDFHSETLFRRMLDLEIKRARRSAKPFILVLIHMNDGSFNGHGKWQEAVSSGFRETDFRGWYKQDSVIGIAFTDLNSAGGDTRGVLFSKVLSALALRAQPEEMRNLYLTFHTFPSSRDEASCSGRIDLGDYPGLANQNGGADFLSWLKGALRSVLALWIP